MVPNAESAVASEGPDVSPESEGALVAGVVVEGVVAAGVSAGVFEPPVSDEHADKPRMASDDTAMPMANRDFMGVPFVRYDRGHGHLEHDAEAAEVHQFDENVPTALGQLAIEPVRMTWPPADTT